MKHRMIYYLLTLCFGLFLMPRQTLGAFPSDLDKRPLTCHSITSADVVVYEDAAATKEAATVAGDGLLLKAKRVSKNQQMLYGAYTNDNTGTKGKGWIKAGTFVVDPDYESTYATVRAEMEIYSTSKLNHYRTSIKKYSGIITVSKKNDAWQVIYEGKHGYGIGWMSGDEHANSLSYDGRDKQVLADGSYVFDGGRSLFVTYDYQGHYYLFDEESQSYLTMEKADLKDMEEGKQEDTGAANQSGQPEKKKGILSFIKSLFDKSYREEVERTKKQEEARQELIREREELLKQGLIYEDRLHNVSYSIIETNDQPHKGEWKLVRGASGYAVAYGNTGIYLHVGEDLSLDEEPDHYHRVLANQPVLNKKAPMVFTQYDPAWCGKAYGSEGCIGTAGCGLLATVNAVYALTGQYMDVMELADYAVEKGFRIIGNGTSEGIFKAGAATFGQRYGYEWDGSSDRIDRLKKKLKKGDTAVAHVIGHYVAIVAYNEKKNTFLLLDSNCLPKRDTTAFGDWISQSRLESGYLYGQNYYFFRRVKE